MKKMDLDRKGFKEEELRGCDIMGIDLGTTNSAVSVFSAETVPMLLPIGEHGKHTVPSCVRWNANAENESEAWTVGAEAYRERYLPDVIYSVKRMMGSGKTVRFTDRDNPDHYIDRTPAEVSGSILAHIAAQVAELYRPIKKCIITVPAYFDQRQMNDTILAAELAGLECLQILKEPTSASFIYSLLGYASSGAVLIYDLGGGTFDATHMTFLRKDAVPKKMATSLKRQYGIDINSNGGDMTDQYYSRVIGTWGDMQLGGDDVDQLLGDLVIKEGHHKLTVEEREQLYLRCEMFKKRGVAAEDIVIGHHKLHLSEDMLNQCYDEIFDRTLKIIEQVDMASVSTIVLVGGSTRSKHLQECLQRQFPDKEISLVLDPDATVALGAGAVAKALSDKKCLDYSDVLPLPIGVLVNEKEVEVCLQKNTSMPYSVSRTYYTAHDNQERVTVHVFQGLSKKPERCTYLGRVTVEDVPRRPAGDVRVKLTFVLTGEGRLKVISQVDGVDREEVLTVDNIFSATADDGVVTKATGDAFEAQDDFESMVYSTDDSERTIQMLLQRRELPEGSGEREDLEQEIFSKIMG